MRTFLLLNKLFLALAVLASTSHSITGNAAKALTHHDGTNAVFPRVTVKLKSATNTTILFKAENGKQVTTFPSPGRQIPHLILNRNGVLTPGSERTLVLSLEHLTVPPAGLYVRLVIETQHSDPDLGRKNTNKIRLWEETRFVPYSPESQQSTPVNFDLTFQGLQKRLKKSIGTPTDYYSYRITLLDSQGKTLQEIDEEYAFLMENQWRVALPMVLEDSPGAAPNELVIYSYDMIPFQADLRDQDTQIPRQAVGGYIQTELIPTMVEAFKTQTDLWNFPWYAEWTNYRTDEGSKTLSVALGDHGTWFHGAAPSIGHALISIRVDGSFREYSSLTDGILSAFHHELFHNQQRNISMHFGGTGNVAGMENAWQLFTEGTAVLASLVGQPSVQFEPAMEMRAYLKRANTFIGSEGDFVGDLNRSYQKVPYDFAIYWRFLYERCGGLKNGMEDPATGMKVIHHALEALYKGEVVDINSSTKVIRSLPRVLDMALQATPTCPFHTYEESLVHFARAIYLLRLEDGRCSTSNDSPSCGFYDPDQLYPMPPAEEYLIQAGSTTQINGLIPTSYGMDLIEVKLDPSVERKELKLIFKGISDPESDFNVEVWKIKNTHNGVETERYSSPMDQPQSTRTKNGSLTMEIGNLSVNDFNSLGLIITRTDSFESQASSGRYLIQLVE